MKFDSLEHFGLDPWKTSLFGMAGALTFELAFSAMVGGVLGSSTPAVELVLGALIFYVIVTAPRRAIASSRIAQAKDAVLLSATCAALTAVTGSKAKVFFAVKPKEEELKRTVNEVRRGILLGGQVDATVRSAAESLVSYSAASALRAAVTLGERESGEGGEESQGLENAVQLSRETKLPVFMTACFFCPMLLLLFAVFAKISQPAGLSELLALLVIVLDVAFFVCSTGGRG